MTPLEIILLVVIFTLMLGMGATVDALSLEDVIRGPQRFALVCGFCCQYGIMPLAAWTLGKVLMLDQEYALALLLVGSMPGGTTSNFFCYLAAGDVALSIAMTVASSLAGVGMVPLALLIYAPSITDVDGDTIDVAVKVPYLEVFFSMLLVLIPASLGVATRCKSERAAKIMEKAGTLAGALFIAGAYVVGLMENTQVLLSEHWTIWLAAGLLQPIGVLLGFLVGKLLRLPAKSTVTVALETGVQNSSLAITILAISYNEGPLLNKLLVIPLMYSMFLIVESLLAVLVMRLLKCVPETESSAPSLEGAKTMQEEEEKEEPTADSNAPGAGHGQAAATSTSVVLDVADVVLHVSATSETKHDANTRNIVRSFSL